MEQIYDSTHSGQHVDAAVDAALTTIPNQLTQIGLNLGDLTQLQTTEKSSLVGAINEVNSKSGDLESKVNTIDDELTEQWVETTIPQTGDTSFFIQTNVGVGNVVDMTPVKSSYSNFKYYVHSCEPGHHIIINGTGTSAGRLWCFTDAEYKVISASANSATGDNLELIVPFGAAYIIINDRTGLGIQYYKKNGTIFVLNESIDSLNEEVKEEELISFTDISYFELGYYLPTDATSFSQENLVYNANLCYRHFEIPQSDRELYVIAYCGFRDAYTFENIFFLDSENNVIGTPKKLYLQETKYEIPENAVYICVCFLKNYTPFGIKVSCVPEIYEKIKSYLEPYLEPYIEEVVDNKKPEIEESVKSDLTNYLTIVNSHQERTLRDFCYEQEKRNPFEWKPFTKRWFAFMNDDANQDMTQYYAVCRDRRVPYCHAFILNRYSSYTYTGNDANRKNLVKNPAVGEEYTCDKLATQTYLRVYIDRQYTVGYPIVISVNGTSHTISSPENARISIGSGASVTFTITSIGTGDDEITSGRTNFINIIATSDSTDSATGTATWTVQDTIKNIVFDFGEILAHDTPVINMWDLKEAENYYAKYIFDDTRKIDELLGEEHCKGAILPGGPNSDRGMNTVLGQHYCCRYLLYSDYYGTTPQYMIRRYSYGTIIGSTTVDYETAKANAMSWLANRANGFYPLFTHSNKTPQEVAGVIDAILESENTICSNWFNAYEQNS